MGSETACIAYNTSSVEHNSCCFNLYIVLRTTVVKMTILLLLLSLCVVTATQLTSPRFFDNVPVSLGVFVCLFVNTITSERVNIGWRNLGARWTFKNSTEFQFGGHSPLGAHTPKTWRWLRRWENQSGLSIRKTRAYFNECYFTIRKEKVSSDTTLNCTADKNA